jgi:hypothetical protein
MEDETLTDDRATKKVTPPYATPAGLSLFFEKIKTIKPAALTTKWAEDHELPFADAIVNTMKFLKAVNKDGSLTPEFARLRLEGEPFQETLSKLVSAAYSPVFDQLEDVGSVTESNLNNAFKSAYDVGSPGRYVRPFLTLCELSGLRRPAAAAEAPRQRSQTKPRVPKTPPKSVESRPDVKSRPMVGLAKASPTTIQIILRLDIPWNASIDEIRERVQALSALAPTVDE